jgi:uncharacterized membrane protein
MSSSEKYILFSTLIDRTFLLFLRHENSSIFCILGVHHAVLVVSVVVVVVSVVVVVLVSAVVVVVSVMMVVSVVVDMLDCSVDMHHCSVDTTFVSCLFLLCLSRESFLENSISHSGKSRRHHREL